MNFIASSPGIPSISIFGPCLQSLKETHPASYLKKKFYLSRILSGIELCAQQIKGSNQMEPSGIILIIKIMYIVVNQD